MQMIHRVLQHIYETVSLKIILIAPPCHRPILVSYITEHVGRFSKETTTLRESVVTGKGEIFYPDPKIVNSTARVPLTDNSLQGNFQESKTRKLSSMRNGTKKDYTAKFKQFSSWCAEWKVDPFLDSVGDFANFLTSLFERGLKYRTINGNTYRCYYLICMYLLLTIVQLGSIPTVSVSYKGIFNKRPPVKRLMASWDVCFNSACLREDPFEPLNNAFNNSHGRLVFWLPYQHFGDVELFSLYR